MNYGIIILEQDFGFAFFVMLKVRAGGFRESFNRHNRYFRFMPYQTTAVNTEKFHIAAKIRRKRSWFFIFSYFMTAATAFSIFPNKINFVFHSAKNEKLQSALSQIQKKTTEAKQLTVPQAATKPPRATERTSIVDEYIPSLVAQTASRETEKPAEHTPPELPETAADSSNADSWDSLTQSRMTNSDPNLSSDVATRLYEQGQYDSISFRLIEAFEKEHKFDFSMQPVTAKEKQTYNTKVFQLWQTFFDYEQQNGGLPKGYLPSTRYHPYFTGITLPDDASIRQMNEEAKRSMEYNTAFVRF